MRVFLMRHGAAVSRAESDRARVLSDAGRFEVQAVAVAMDAAGIGFDAVLASPYPRAWQTAAIVCGELGIRDPLRCPELEPGNDPRTALAQFGEQECESMLVVGHMPGISQLGGIMVDGRPDAAPGFHTAAVMAVETEVPAAGCGRLLWYREPADWR